jgi:hypothetical protein
MGQNSLEKAGAMFGSGVSIHQSMMHVSAVHEVDDSENYTSEGDSVGSINGAGRYEMTREMTECLSGVVDLDEKPI